MLKVPDHSDAASTGHSTSCRAAQPCWPLRAPAYSSSHHSAYRTLPSAPHLYGESPRVSAELTILPVQHLNNVFFLLGWVMFWFGSLQLFLFFFFLPQQQEPAQGGSRKAAMEEVGAQWGTGPAHPNHCAMVQEFGSSSGFASIDSYDLQWLVSQRGKNNLNLKSYFSTRSIPHCCSPQNSTSSLPPRRQNEAQSGEQIRKQGGNSRNCLYWECHQNILAKQHIKKTFHVLCFAPVLAQPKVFFSNLSEKITVKVQGFKTH